MAIDRLEELRRGDVAGGRSNSVRIPMTTNVRNTPDGLIQARATPARIDDSMGQAMQNAGRALGQYADYQIQRDIQNQRVEANAAFANDVLKLNDAFLEANQSIKAGGADFAKDFESVIDRHVQEATKDKPQFFRDEYMRHMQSRKQSFMERAKLIQIQEGARYKLENISNDVNAVVQDLTTDPSDTTYKYNLERLNKLIDDDPQLRVDVKAKAKENIKDQLSWVVTMKRAEQAAKSSAGYGESASRPVATPSGFDGVMPMILKHEGGYTARDGSSGAPANFGINQKFNPDIDVKNLTKEEAVKLYKTRYWDAIGGDKLPPELQATAMDAAVNQGPANAKKWIEQSGGDVAKFNALRQEHYKKLADSGNYTAAEIRSWNNRMRSVTNSAGSYASGEGGLAAVAGEAYNALDFNKRMQADRYYEQQVRQQQASNFANLAIESAKQVVAENPLGPDDVANLPLLKAEAVRRAAGRAGGLDPQQQERIEAQVERAVADAERQAKRQQAADMKDAFDVLDSNGGDYQALVRDNPALVARLGRDGAERINKYAGEVATGKTRPTDWQSYNTLVNDPSVLKSTNLDAMRDRFNANELTQLKQMQAKLMSGEIKEDNIQSDLSVVKGMLKDAKVTDDKKEAMFFSMFQTAINQELQATGKKGLTQERKKEIAADLLVRGITERGRLWDSTGPAFTVAVPDGERVKIESALRAEGMPVNDYMVSRMYFQKLNKKSVLQKNSPLVDQIPR